MELDEYPDPQEPRMKRWVDMMAHHGGSLIDSYDEKLFKWFKKQLIMIEDYAYTWMDFQGDPNLVHPEGYH